MMERLRSFERSAFPHTNETLAAFRILFFFTLLAWGDWRSLTWAADYPDWLRNPPPGLPSLWPGVPPLAVLVALQWARISFAAAALVGFRTKWASIGYSLVTLVHHSVEFGFGKIDHDLLSVLAPVVLASSGWGEAYSVDAASGRTNPGHDWAVRNAHAVAVFYTVAAVAFFTAAFAKILGGWLDPTQAMAASWIQLYRVIQPDEAPLAATVQLSPYRDSS